MRCLSNRSTPLLLACAITTALPMLQSGCATTRSAYYDAWEKLGYPKRQRLVDNVKAARDKQDEAKQQFASALDQFKSVVNFKGGDLEALYGKLNAQYEKCDGDASAVRSKIGSVKHVAGALFDEWQGEIDQMKDDPSLQSQSKELYAKTHQNYDQLVRRMDAAAATMDPVLTKFHNRVLFIKANLNAQAIASLQGTELELGGDINNLIKQMEASIAEADRFIAQVQSSKK